MKCVVPLAVALLAVTLLAVVTVSQSALPNRKNTSTRESSQLYQVSSTTSLVFFRDIPHLPSRWRPSPR